MRSLYVSGFQPSELSFAADLGLRPRLVSGAPATPVVVAGPGKYGRARGVPQRLKPRDGYGRAKALPMSKADPIAHGDDAVAGLEN